MLLNYYSILIYTKDEKLMSVIKSILPVQIFESEFSSDINAVKRNLSNRRYDVILLDAEDPEVIEFSFSVGDDSTVVVLLCPVSNFETVSERVEGNGIITLAKPFDSFRFYSIMKIVIAVVHKMQNINLKTIKLKEKMDEIRIVNRAKLLLVKNLSMTEQEAHRHIEKKAMDRCLKKSEIAEQIIRTYG